MTDRYAFRYNEFKIMQIEQKKRFDYVEKTPLLADIGARMQGICFCEGESPLAFLGIRTGQKDDSLGILQQDASDYGVDALRIALLENKMPVSHEQKAAGWRLADKLWLSLREKQLCDFNQLNQPLFYPFVQEAQNKNWKKAWIALKTIMNADVEPVLAFCLYPFMPHLIQSIHFDIHSKMAEFWTFLQQIKVPKRYFIELNGHFVCDFYPEDEKDFEKIKKEALSFSLVQNKIKEKQIKNIIHIVGKGVNFVV